MKRAILLTWTAAAFVAIAVVTVILWHHRELYGSESSDIPPNRAKSKGDAKCVSDIRVGWCNNDGHVIQRNLFTDSFIVTVFLQNFDGWLLDHAQSESRLLPADLKDDFRNYLTLREVADKLTSEQQTKLKTLQGRVNHWIVQERSNLRLTIAGQVFETIPPFDTTASSTFGTGEFAEETYNRVVFHLSAPTDPKELEKWRQIIRAVGGDCAAEISVSRPIAGAGEALRIPTLVNSDTAYIKGATIVTRSLPLIHPMRQVCAAITVIFTIASVLAAATGTQALRDGRDPTWTSSDIAPWSLSRVVFAWWLTISVGCFSYLWALLGEHKSILSSTVPLLLGIQGTTMLISAGFSNTHATSPSRGFFADLISENGQPEVSRLQMLVWNLVLGVVFVWQSVFEWKMPVFDATLMTLLGISSTAYVGFKFLPPSASPAETRPKPPISPPQAERAAR